MSWRRFALCMTAACGGLLMAMDRPVSAVLLLCAAIVAAVLTEVRL